MHENTDSVGLLIVFAMIVAAVLAMLTHIIVCIKTASWGLLIAGAIMFPIGVIHGFGAWFGVW